MVPAVDTLTIVRAEGGAGMATLQHFSLRGITSRLENYRQNAGSPRKGVTP